LLLGGAGPLASQFGLPHVRPAPASERRIDRAEGEALGERLQELSRSPGVVLVGTETRRILAPILRSERTWPETTGSPPLVTIGWNERRIVEVGMRIAPSVDESAPRTSHLVRTLRYAERDQSLSTLLLRDTVLIAAADAGWLDSIRGLGAPEASGAELLVPVFETESFQAARLDVAAFHAALDARRRALRKERGRREVGSPGAVRGAIPDE